MFITLEGIEGSGKTTQIKHIIKYLESVGRGCIVTREPGGTRIGQKIRAILLDPENQTLDPLAELLLYLADRAQHINEIILPELKAGRTVICDRYFDATLAYQGEARALESGLIRQLHRLLFNALTPDITLLLDLSPEVGLARAWQQIHQGRRCNTETRFEKEALAFHERVRAGYLTLASQAPNRFKIINAENSESEVTRAIVHALSAAIGKGTGIDS